MLLEQPDQEEFKHIVCSVSHCRAQNDAVLYICDADNCDLLSHLPSLPSRWTPPLSSPLLPTATHLHTWHHLRRKLNHPFPLPPFLTLTPTPTPAPTPTFPPSAFHPHSILILISTYPLSLPFLSPPLEYKNPSRLAPGYHLSLEL